MQDVLHEPVALDTAAMGPGSSVTSHFPCPRPQQQMTLLGKRSNLVRLVRASLDLLLASPAGVSVKLRGGGSQFICVISASAAHRRRLRAREAAENVTRTA